ncbi:WecB/TagA/CpsF family glycosyltransferase [Photobacterium halotolerans]|uniref:WecB/TagA/CpsF family glycosyltransferase n=1 Tax=Photobacterium halotolerans TaxID=265726 RepID=UPI00040DB695|nr:WecB/TagA/CpsF family glycosyltransferase [Photobacterium halotolerans]
MHIDSVVISGLNISCFKSMDEAVDMIFDDYIYTEKTGLAVAMNPEKIMMYRIDETVKETVDFSTLRYIDGIGVAKLASSKLNKDIPRIPGCELWEELMVRAGREHLPVYLIGASSEVLTNTVLKLAEKYNVNVVGFRDGYFSDEDEVIEHIRMVQPRILTVAMGSPRQELFMKKCKDSGLCCFMMGVGGTYDVFTGKVKRAPKLFRKTGLEWAYRLLSQPTRFMRQIKLIKFSILVLTNKI